MNLKNAYKLILSAVLTIVFINVFAIIDSNIRTRQYLKKAKQYAAWHQNPSAKEKYFEEKFSKLLKKTKTTNLIKTGQKLENLNFLKNFKINESSAKYAYFWNKKAGETFTGPFIFIETDLTDDIEKSKKIWIRELQKKKIKFEDYMLD